MHSNADKANLLNPLYKSLMHIAYFDVDNIVKKISDNKILKIISMLALCALSRQIFFWRDDKFP